MSYFVPKWQNSLKEINFLCNFFFTYRGKNCLKFIKILSVKFNKYIFYYLRYPRFRSNLKKWINFLKRYIILLKVLTLSFHNFSRLYIVQKMVMYFCNILDKRIKWMIGKQMVLIGVIVGKNHQPEIEPTLSTVSYTDQ